MACLSKAPSRKPASPRAKRPDQEDAIKRKLLDRVLPTAKVTLQPQVLVVVSNGLRLKAEVKKYSPAPVGANRAPCRGKTWRCSRLRAMTFPC